MGNCILNYANIVHTKCTSGESIGQLFHSMVLLPIWYQYYCDTIDYLICDPQCAEWWWWFVCGDEWMRPNQFDIISHHIDVYIQREIQCRRHSDWHFIVIIFAFAGMGMALLVLSPPLSEKVSFIHSAIECNIARIILQMNCFV